MEYISYGESKSNVSNIVLGMMRIDSLTPKEVEKLIDTALDEGINAFDLADCYGGGKCEELVGEVLSKRADLREKMWIQSKCGIRIDTKVKFFDFSKEHIANAVDGILKRLKIERLDSLLLHRPDVLMEPDEINDAINTLKKAGKIADFGVSNMNPMMIELLKKGVKCPISANQLQLSCAFTPAFDAGFHVNMSVDKAIDRDGDIFEYCRLNDIAIQAWSSLQYGFFEGVFVGNEKFDELNRVLERIAKEQKVTPSAVAIAWILRYPAKMQAIIGTTKASRVKELAKASMIRLSKEEWYEIYLAAGNDLP